MFILLQNDGKSYTLLNKSSYVIGRKNADILLSHDSISRNHTRIIVRDKKVYAEDLNSSNKTFINNKALEPHNEERVSIGSEIKLGLRGIHFILTKESLVVTTSGLNIDQKQNVKDLVNKMDGLCIENWSSECTHLVVNSLSCTLKVMCALITKIQIVTKKYIEERNKAVENRKPLPNPLLFRPNLQINLTSVKKLNVEFDLNRSKLFNNKVFVFPSVKDFQKIKEAVILAGGEAIAFSNSPVSEMTLSKTKLEYLFITTENSNKDKDSVFNSRIRFLATKKRRHIPMQEIALAVISNKCNINCNSMFNKLEHLFSAKKVTAKENILVAETQSYPLDTQTPDVGSSIKIIPATFESNIEEMSEVITIDSNDEENDNRCSTKENNKRNADPLFGKVTKIPKLVDTLAPSSDFLNLESSEIKNISSDGQDNTSKIDNTKKRKLVVENEPNLEEVSSQITKKVGVSLKELIGDSTEKRKIVSSETLNKKKQVENPLKTPLEELKETTSDNSTKRSENESSDTLNKKINFKNPYGTSLNELKENTSDNYTEKYENESSDTLNKRKQVKNPYVAFLNKFKKSASDNSPEKRKNESSDELKESTTSTEKRKNESSDTPPKKQKFGHLFNSPSNKSKGEDTTDNSNLESKSLCSDTPNKNNNSTLIETKENTGIKNEKLLSLAEMSDNFHSHKVKTKSELKFTSVSFNSTTSSLLNPGHNKSTRKWLDKTTKFEDCNNSCVILEDEIMKAFSKSFKEAVVKIDNSIIKKKIGESFQNTSLIVGDKINFKKFKKVMPLKVQTRIIPMSDREKIICGASGGVEHFPEEEIEEKEDLQTQAVVKPTTKKFALLEL